jgi:Pro-kumamolisin, activation domain
MSLGRSSSPILERAEIARSFGVSTITEELIRDPVLDSERVQVIDSVDATATIGTDLGVAACLRRVEGVTILLKRSDRHEVALHTLLGEIHNPSSSCYRRRFLLEDIAALFGLAERDIEKIVLWLESHSLESVRVSPARTSVRCAGTLHAIETAFRTQFRCYRVEGREYLANAYECSIPAAFSTVVSAVCNLSFLTVGRTVKKETERPTESHRAIDQC